jgi:hypothetical protein
MHVSVVRGAVIKKRCVMFRGEGPNMGYRFVLGLLVEGYFINFQRKYTYAQNDFLAQKF